MPINTNALQLKSANTLTIASGALSPTQALTIVAAQSGTADDLDTINLTGFVSLSDSTNTFRPMVILIADSGDTITVKDGTGNIQLNANADFSLTGNAQLLLVYNGTNWTDVGASGGGGGGGMTSFNVAADSGTPQTITDGNTLTIVGGTGLDSVASATDTVTLAIDSTVVTLTGTQTLTDKTLTAPKINVLADTNGNEIITLTTTASAVNELTVANAATANAPTISATGGDTNIGITVNPKGTGVVSIDGAVTINEAGADRDTRIEGDTNANLFFVDASADAIGIGTNAPSSKAIIDVVSTTQASRPAPSMTTTQRDAITSPVAGLIIYNTTNSRFEFYNGTTWGALGSGGNYVALANNTLGASASSINITSISGSYRHLKLFLALRSDRAATSDQWRIRFNGDTGSNYSAYGLRTFGSTAGLAGTETTTGTGILSQAISVPAASATANYFGVLELTIMNYISTTLPRNVFYHGATQLNTTTGNLYFISGTGLWANTANAITSIDIAPVTGTNWVSGSAYELYGISV